VDAVEPAARSIWEETLADSLSRRFQRQILALPDARRPVTNAMIDAMINYLPAERRATFPIDRLGSRNHPLIDAVHTAFAEHRPLTLSPDCIWLALAQGFSHHVTENAETLRPRLVRHQGRRALRAEVTNLTLADFEKAIAGFSSQIRAATDPVLT